MFSLSAAFSAKLGQRHNVGFEVENKPFLSSPNVCSNQENLSPVKRFASFPKQTPDCIPSDLSMPLFAILDVAILGYTCYTAQRVCM